MKRACLFLAGLAFLASAHQEVQAQEAIDLRLSGEVPQIPAFMTAQPVPVQPKSVPEARQPGQGMVLEELADVGPANMLGDANGGACGSATFAGVTSARVDHPVLFCNQIKIADNSSPIPQDRVFFTYQLFKDTTHLALLAHPTEEQFSIHRYVFGVEKTFFDRNMSLQVVLPFNTQLGNNFTAIEAIPAFDSNYATSIGNVAAALKGLVYSGPALQLSAGLLMQFPTAPNVTFNQFGTHELTKEALAQILPKSPELQAVITGLGLPPGDFPFVVNNSFQFRNQSVIMSPFLGGLFTPTDRWFTHGFLQFDFDASGSEIVLTPRFQAFTPGGITRRVRVEQPLTDIAPEAFTPTGVPIPTAAIAGPFGLPTSQQTRRLHQQVLMRLDVGTGYWIYRDPEACWVTGFAPTIEAHYTTTLSNAKLANFHLVGSPQTPFQTEAQVGNSSNRLDIVNLLLGFTTEFSSRSTLAFGYVIPLSTGDNKPFNYEINLQLNYRF